jgi:hypothetical protein
MADQDEQALTDEEIVVEDPTTVVEDVKAAEEERQDAQATDDPNDNIAAATTDVGREIAVPSEVADADAPPEETVTVSLNDNFKVPVYEEYTDDKGVTHGRVASYEAPSDVRIYVASADAVGIGDEDGYITLPSEVPASVGTSLENNPAVVVE